MRVYTADEMQVLDQLTFDRLGLPSCAIMENAGRQVVEVLLDRFGEEAAGSIVVLCGP